MKDGEVFKKDASGAKIVKELTLSRQKLKDLIEKYLGEKAIAEFTSVVLDTFKNEKYENSS